MSDVIVIGRTSSGETFGINTDTLLKHTVVLGATGSGKTTLCKAIVEELALKGYSIIAIDPKGDIGALAIASPDLDFRPWSDLEAKERGIDPGEYAERLRGLYLRELSKWGVSREKICDYVENVRVVIYTPRSSTGVPLSIRPSLDPIPNIREIVAEDKTVLYDAIDNTVSLLLRLAGYGERNTQEHALLSQIIETHWLDGESISLEDLVQEVINPPFDQIGSLAVEDFIPQRARLKLARSLNVLLSHPTYKSWLDGEMINFGKFNQRGTISVIDLRFMTTMEEKQFFIGAFLQELYRWLLRQGGTSSLRLLLYFDELVGFIPPVGKPPSKAGLMLLIKQGRAFGLGCLLATQNPADIDYKVLSNAAHRFVGRLATRQDIAKVKKGLNIDEDLTEIIPRLRPRTFLYHNYESGRTVIVEPRWLITYHRGPLQPSEIRMLVGKRPIVKPKRALKDIKAPSESLPILRPKLSKEEVLRKFKALGLKIVGFDIEAEALPYYLLRSALRLRLKKLQLSRGEHVLVVMKGKKLQLMEHLGEVRDLPLVYDLYDFRAQSTSIPSPPRDEVISMLRQLLKTKVYYVAPLEVATFDKSELTPLMKRLEEKVKGELEREEEELRLRFELKKRELLNTKPVLEAELKLHESDYKSLKHRVQRLEEIREELRKRRLNTRDVTKELRKLKRELRLAEKNVLKLKKAIKSLIDELDTIERSYEEKREALVRKYEAFLKAAVQEIEVRPDLRIVEEGRVFILRYRLKLAYGASSVSTLIDPYSLKASFGRCIVCGKLVEKSLSTITSLVEVPLCKHCGAPLCTSHIIKCSYCASPLCVKHVSLCVVCGKPLCSDHVHLCSICNAPVCPSHIIRCSSCGRELCPSHALTCSSCGRPICPECAIIKRTFFRKRVLCPSCAGLRKEDSILELSTD